MPFALAVVISVSLHLAGLTMPGWGLPEEIETEPQSMHAVLIPKQEKNEKPVPIPKPKTKTVKTQPKKTLLAKKKLKKKTKQKKSPTVLPNLVTTKTETLPQLEIPEEPDGEESSIAGSSIEQSEGLPEVEEEVREDVKPSDNFPQSGSLRYVGTYGDNEFVLGDIITEWKVTGDTYRITTRGSPSGILALFGTSREQTSRGQITSQGLRPISYFDQIGNRPAKTVEIDWNNASAKLSRADTPQAVTPGTQDPVSVFFQLAWIMPRQDERIFVATSKRVSAWDFIWQGEEDLVVKIPPAGNNQPVILGPPPPRQFLNCQHLRAETDDTIINIWLAPGQGGLPVKIKMYDKQKDSRFEMISDKLQSLPEKVPEK